MSTAIFIVITLVLLGLVLYGLHRRDQQKGQYSKYANFPVPPEAEKLPNHLQKVDTPLDMAVHELWPLFDGMDQYFERMSEDTFRSYCHSQVSGGIGMKIRNHFRFWEMYSKKLEKSPLYEFLYDKMNAHHPDGMSDIIVKAIYRRYHKEHPEAWQEVKRFEQYKHSPQYKPGPLPFDVRYPSEK